MDNTKMTQQEFQEFVKQQDSTQSALAVMLGCSQSSISEWLHGKRSIPKKVEIIIHLLHEQQKEKTV